MLKSYLKKWIFMVLVFLLFVNCNNKGTEPEQEDFNITEPAIYGIVKDSGGKPIQGVDVHMLFFNEEDVWKYRKSPKFNITSSNKITDSYIYQNFPNPFNVQTNIVYRLDEKNNILLSLYDYNDNLIRCLLNEEKESGDYFIKWDGKNDKGEFARLGFYRCILKINNIQDEMNICFNDYDPECVLFMNYISFTRTNEKGNFKLHYSEIPVGEKIYITGEDGPEPLAIHTVEYIYLLLLKKDYQYIFQKVELDTSKAINLDLMLYTEK